MGRGKQHDQLGASLAALEQAAQQQPAPGSELALATSQEVVRVAPSYDQYMREGGRFGAQRRAEEAQRAQRGSLLLDAVLGAQERRAAALPAGPTTGGNGYRGTGHGSSHQKDPNAADRIVDTQPGRLRSLLSTRRRKWTAAIAATAVLAGGVGLETKNVLASHSGSPTAEMSTDHSPILNTQILGKTACKPSVKLNVLGGIGDVQLPISIKDKSGQELPNSYVDLVSLMARAMNVSMCAKLGSNKEAKALATYHNGKWVIDRSTVEQSVSLDKAAAFPASPQGADSVKSMGWWNNGTLYANGQPAKDPTAIVWPAGEQARLQGVLKQLGAAVGKAGYNATQQAMIAKLQAAQYQSADTQEKSDIQSIQDSETGAAVAKLRNVPVSKISFIGEYPPLLSGLEASSDVTKLLANKSITVNQANYTPTFAAVEVTSTSKKGTS